MITLIASHAVMSHVLAAASHSAPAITTDTGGIHVVATTPFGAIGDEAVSNGIRTWQWTAVTGTFTATSNPAVTMNDGIENIADIGSDGTCTSTGNTVPGQYIQELVDTAANR